jgi:hypothetical protein
MAACWNHGNARSLREVTAHFSSVVACERAGA